MTSGERKHNFANGKKDEEEKAARWTPCHGQRSTTEEKRRQEFSKKTKRTMTKCSRAGQDVRYATRWHSSIIHVCWRLWRNKNNLVERFVVLIIREKSGEI